MKLLISQSLSKHTDIVTSLSWSSSTLYSISDDKTILNWNINGDYVNKIIDIETYATCLQFLNTSTLSNENDIFAYGNADGSFKIMQKNGRVEKHIQDAHHGAITSLQWNYDGSALLTSGEDGTVKQWSRNGSLRSKLTQVENPIYCAVWAPDDQSVLYCTDSYIIIKSLQVTSKQTKWKAHDGSVLKVDWNPVNNLIVSGGEDCKYKVWDSYGRLLYCSKPNEFAITSIAWAPSGDFFAVGSFNSISLCDKAGWVYSRSTTDSGSLFHLSWSADGTNVAGAGGNGAVCFGQVVERKKQWQNYFMVLNSNNHIVVTDVLNDASVTEELEFGDRVIEMSICYDYLVVATSRQCYIYSLKNMTTPHIFDIKGSVSLILQSAKYFVLIDNSKGISVYSYEGRLICSPKIAGLRSEFLRYGNISLSSDILAFIDRVKPNQVLLYDISSGRALDTIKHKVDINYIALNQPGLASDRKLVFVDKNMDLFITAIHRIDFVKLATITESVIWSETYDILAAISDQKLMVWYYPNVVYVDRDLLPKTRVSIDASSYGAFPQLVSFLNSQITIRRSDGAVLTSMISPYISELHQYCGSVQYPKAIRLCRYIKDPHLWTSLAAFALNGGDLETTELCLAAIDEVEKLNFIQHVRKIPSQEGRAAALAMFKKRIDQAESILLSAQPPFAWRAIEMNLILHKYERALEIAQQYRTHIDTVAYYRNLYLQKFSRKETNAKFLQLALTVNTDLEAILNNIDKDVSAEKKRAGVVEGEDINANSILGSRTSGYSLGV